MKKILSLMICLLIIPGLVLAAETKAVVKTSTNLAENAKSAIMIEASSGKVLFDKNSHEKLPPASMTKMMSMLLIVEAVEDGIISWDQKITVSENASGMGGSQILLETGEQMSVDDLFKGVAIMSGNDAVVALAEAVAGTEDEFVKMMNKRAKELGLKDSVFKNPHGLDDANHYSSAYDMSLIAKELVKHDRVLKYTSTYEDYLRKGTERELWLTNTNKLTRFYPGVDGLKTGYTKEAGYCLTSTAKRDGMRIITVVMGEPDTKTRNSETSTMLDYAFAQYKVEELINKKSVIAKKEVEKGKTKYVKIVPKEDIVLLTKKTDKIGKITYNLNLKKVKAPVKKGKVLGDIEVKRNGKIINKVNVTVKNDVKKANFIELYWRYLSDILGGNINV